MKFTNLISGTATRVERCAFITCSEWEKVIVWGHETGFLTSKEVDICRSISSKKSIDKEPSYKQAYTGLKVYDKYLFYKKVARSLVEKQIEIAESKLQELRQNPGISAEDYVKEDLGDLEATLSRISHRL